MNKMDFYLFDDKKLKVTISVSDQKMKLLSLVYGFKSEQEIHDYLLKGMEDELFAIYGRFENLKADYENYIDEIIDVGVAGRTAHLYMTKQKNGSFAQEVDSLLTTGSLNIGR